MAQEGQEHPISTYLWVWILLFVLSACSYAVDYIGFQGFTRWSLVILFMFLKAYFICAVFMHMVWERMALVLALFIPTFAIVVFVGIMGFESDYTQLGGNNVWCLDDPGQSSTNACMDPRTPYLQVCGWYKTRCI